MGIVVACRCGQGFEADLDLAGKVVQCPACQSPIAVPTPAVEAPVAAYVPRSRPALSREEKETKESFITIVVAAIVVLMAVLGVSIAIVGHLKGSDPRRWVKMTAEPSAAPGSGVQPADGLVPIAAPGGLQEGWRFFDHAEGKFSAMLPSPPESSETRVDSLAGTQTIYSMLATKNEHTYEASREFRTFTISRGQEEAVYDFLLKKRGAEMEDGRIEGSNNAMVDGRLVCDGILRGKAEGIEFRRYLRIIAADDWILELSCRVPLGKERPADIKLFLGNYKVQ